MLSEFNASLEVQTFAKCIYNPTDIVEIRAIRVIRQKDTKQKWLQAEKLHDPVVVGRCCALNSDGYNIYVGANPRNAMEATGDKSIEVYRVCFVDFDYLSVPSENEMLDVVTGRIKDAELPDPTVVVNSGHGIHAYWRFKQPVSAEVWVRIQEGLIACLDTDKVIKNPERIMRLPGFDNVKSIPHVLCKLLYCVADRIYDPQDIELHLPPVTVIQTKPVVSTTSFVKPMEIRARAMLYASKWQTTSLGERNQSAFAHSCQMLNDFLLDEVAAWEIVKQWNASNAPPLDERELRAAYESAKVHAKKPAGCKLDTPCLPHRKATIAKDAVVALRTNIDGIIDGKITVIDFPWSVIGDMTQALIGGTVTTLCGPKGSTKTFWALQCLSHWVLTGTKAAILVLEEDVTHCMKRILAQLAGVSNVTDLKWVKENEVAAMQMLIDYDDQLKQIGPHIWDSPDSEMSLKDIANWVEDRANDRYRIVMVDPITASTQSREPWIHDAAFINEVKRIARKHDVSVILTTHPKKGGSHEVDMDSLAGSSANTRFSQTVLWMAAHDREKKVTIRTSAGRMAFTINRTLHVLAARNGWGRGSRIGLNFSPQTLRFDEVGLIIHEQKEKTDDE